MPELEGDLVALDLTDLDPNLVPTAAPALTQTRMLELQSQLGSPTQRQRQAAIAALATATDKEVTQILPWIIETLKGNTWLAQEAAAQLLQQLGGRAKSVGVYLVPLIQANIKTRDWAIVTILLEALKKVDPASLGEISSSIQEAMDDADQSVRVAAIQFLGSSAVYGWNCGCAAHGSERWEYLFLH